MAKSPLSKGSKQAKNIRNSSNVVPLKLTIPYKSHSDRRAREFDISHLLHHGLNKDNQKIGSRLTYLRSFCKKAHEYVDKGKSVSSITRSYEVLNGYISFCDVIGVVPFTEEGYLKFAGNDGELRHRIKVYNPSKRLWERQHRDELGIKESSACNIVSLLTTVFSWCGLPVKTWKTQHRTFHHLSTPIKGYSDKEEELIITRLSDLFFTLAPQLIAAKQDNLALPYKLPMTIGVGEHKEMLTIPTSLNSKKGKVNHASAFNLTMGAAYHLLCYFTSLNDSVVRDIAHPITIHTHECDKSLRTVKVSGFKARANKEVDAVLTNEIDESKFSFDVEKKDGVLFVQTLDELSRLYGNGEELLFLLDKNKSEHDKFRITELNKHLTSILNLVTPSRASNLPWFKELFYAYRNGQVIELKKTTNELGRIVASKIITPITSKTKMVQGMFNAGYCILSCYTDNSLKGILLPLHYSDKDANGNVIVSYYYQNGDEGSFIIPAADKGLIQDIEQSAIERADKQEAKKDIRLLLRQGNAKEAPKNWEGISPITSNLMTQWSIGINEYFIQLSSSRFRETTSSQEYGDDRLSHIVNLLQNSLETLSKHYINGDPKLNKTIISQGIQVLEKMAQGHSLEEAKEHVKAQHAIPMLSYDEYLKKKQATNPNGLICNGQQQVVNSKNTQRKTNKAIGAVLPCVDYDMCHKCKSAKAVDEPQAIYKLISFIDVLKEALDLYPNAKREVIEKIEAFEYTLDGVTPEVYEEALVLFENNGRHPRISTDHAILSVYR
ncbi:hypothetical protein [Photobacterium sp. 53610]|uniref:hypothetical protein n=1 Tax=Photobacterium sp. 53610 TaxID=3102789 RepID=UPI002ED90BD9